ncbi:hypothetical protein [Cellulomonas dongxiuzhuiae]|uniref:Sortase n=1 Tax=Cellulomonas dongxiuzhuiae TaxID=2819979 RepID=A0ABX8GHC0_9CELL|nr:hypothetical protein [Cellulomonas dongxiuzhuiae]MBO3094183.1 hypothetical protein [Cellulomonas dongxiuzhuiae]QWC15238.1 hypothetical protein KKR89_13040 [Cellulomonas dongxiuzhuiae]
MRRPARAFGVLVAGVVATLLASPAAAAGYGEALVTTWDGPTVNLAWDGSSYTTDSSSFSGTPVVVPGDMQGRTITVTNHGPTDATLRGWVQDVTLLDPDALDIYHSTGVPQGDFYADLTLAWSTASSEGRSSFRQLAAAGATQVVDVPLARGASTQVTVVTALPLTATSGNRANVAPREATYEVLLRLDGRTPPASEGTPPSAGSSATGPASEAGSDAGTAALALTGLDALRAALLAVVAIGVGSTLLGAARRRRDVQNPGGSGTTPSAG